MNRCTHASLLLTILHLPTAAGHSIVHHARRDGSPSPLYPRFPAQFASKLAPHCPASVQLPIAPATASSSSPDIALRDDKRYDRSPLFHQHEVSPRRVDDAGTTESCTETCAASASSAATETQLLRGAGDYSLAHPTVKRGISHRPRSRDALEESRDGASHSGGTRRIVEKD